jgi:hypothetical protein
MGVSPALTMTGPFARSEGQEAFVALALLGIKPTRSERHMVGFARPIGIDYSGARTPRTSLSGLRVYLGEGVGLPVDSANKVPDQQVDC